MSYPCRRDAHPCPFPVHCQFPLRHPCPFLQREKGRVHHAELRAKCLSRTNTGLRKLTQICLASIISQSEGRRQQEPLGQEHHRAHPPEARHLEAHRQGELCGRGVCIASRVLIIYGFLSSRSYIIKTRDAMHTSLHAQTRRLGRWTNIC